MSKMHNPPHPGETLREDVLPATPQRKEYMLAELLANCGDGDFEIDREFLAGGDMGRGA